MWSLNSSFAIVVSIPEIYLTTSGAADQTYWLYICHARNSSAISFFTIFSSLFTFIVNLYFVLRMLYSFCFHLGLLSFHFSFGIYCSFFHCSFFFICIVKIDMQYSINNLFFFCHFKFSFILLDLMQDKVTICTMDVYWPRCTRITSS